jgi:hypothetical protein
MPSGRPPKPKLIYCPKCRRDVLPSQEPGISCVVCAARRAKAERPVGPYQARPDEEQKPHLGLGQTVRLILMRRRHLREKVQAGGPRYHQPGKLLTGEPTAFRRMLNEGRDAE